MAKGKTRTRGPGKGLGSGMMIADGLDHPISFNLCRRLNRFFEGLTILSCLHEACGRRSEVKAPSDTSEPEENHSKALECFINKLAQICDNQRGGFTVTSLAIVQPPDRLLYVFASNQRSHDDIENVREFVFTLLYYLNQASAATVARDDRNSSIFRYVLRNILNFNHNRIEWYRTGLLDRLSQCISDCERYKSELSNQLKEELLKLQRHSFLTPEPAESSFSARSTKNEELVRAATALRQSSTYGQIVDKGKAGKFDESPHWCELQHFIGRLVSYFRATQAILGARKRFPELFDIDSLEILFIDSSRPIPNPMNAFQAGLPPDQRQTVRSAHAILSRMTSDVEKLATYQQYADELQRCDLDHLIASQCLKKTFRPTVHSEVLLLEWLRKEFAAEMYSIPFYAGIKYIGCSKPTCRLCEYYFAAHSSGVRVRPPHRNVYPNWVIPDVLEEGDTSQYKNKMIDAVLVKVRDDVFMALREKVSERKRFDSDTYSSQPTYQSLAGASANLEDLASQLVGLSIAPQAQITHVRARGIVRIMDDAWSVVAQEDEADDDVEDDGGVLMFTGRNMRT